MAKGFDSICHKNMQRRRNQCIDRIHWFSGRVVFQYSCTKRTKHIFFEIYILKVKLIFIALVFRFLKLQLIILNPEHQNDDGEVNMESVATNLIDQLRDGSEITLTIIKMQFCFMKHYQTRGTRFSVNITSKIK